jgi:hypothetical protein
MTKYKSYSSKIDYQGVNMNKIALYVLGVLSALSTPNAILADYPTSHSGPNPSDRPVRMYSDQNQGDEETPGMRGERSYMRRSDSRFGRLRQQNQSMYPQEGEMMRGGYPPSEGYRYTNPPSEHSFRQQQFGGQEQMMRSDDGYSNPRSYYPRSDPATPQSYPIDENSPNPPSGPAYHQQSHYTPRDYSSAYSTNPSEEYQIRHIGDTQQHPVYEYMLGKDGKWRMVSENEAHPDYTNTPTNANWSSSNTNDELGYNAPQDTEPTQRNANSTRVKKGHSSDNNNPDVPQKDNQFMQRTRRDYKSNPAAYNTPSSPYDSASELIGDRTGNTPYSNRNNLSPTTRNER